MLQAAAGEAGFAAPLFLPASGYRSRKQQEALWEKGLKKHGPDKVSTYVARPGSSAHETGRAVDLHLGYGIDSDNEEKIRASEDQFAFLPRVRATRQLLPEVDALGDFDALFEKLDDLEELCVVGLGDLAAG